MPYKLLIIIKIEKNLLGCNLFPLDLNECFFFLNFEVLKT